MKKLITIVALVLSTAVYATEATSVDVAVKFIAEHESFRSRVYVLNGIKHIGYGFTNPKLVKRGYMSKQEADAELRRIVSNDLVYLRRQVKGLTVYQEAACLSFIFNVGRANFASSTMLKLLKRRDIRGAAGEFDNWIYAGGNVCKGLINRREQERKLMLTVA